MVYNKVALIGRLTKDPEITKTPKGTEVSTFTIAVRQDRNRAKANEEKNASTADFFLCKAYGNTANLINNYFFKGSMIAVDGQLRNDRYEKDGQTRYAQYIKVNEVGFLERKKDSVSANESVVDESDFMEIDENEVFNEGEFLDEGVAF